MGQCATVHITRGIGVYPEEMQSKNINMLNGSKEEDEDEDEDEEEEEEEEQKCGCFKGIGKFLICFLL
nr:hypothetical protein [Allomuricauda sp.]|tara:strand:+ start:157 stop:360 length:204 start_codon:yes stop_codon:yes gene_type:complete